jgi:small subunit ribosomal protein S18
MMQGMRPRRRSNRRRKVCSFCVEHAKIIDLRNVSRLRRFLNERGKILPRRQSGTCARHQRMLTMTIKRGRELALLPYIVD